MQRGWPRGKHLPVPLSRPMFFMWQTWHPLYVVPQGPGQPGPQRSRRQRFRAPDPFDFTLQTNATRRERAIPNDQNEEGRASSSAPVSEEMMLEPQGSDDSDTLNKTLPSPDRVPNLWRFGSPPNPLSDSTRFLDSQPQASEVEVGQGTSNEQEGEEERERRKVTLYIEMEDDDSTIHTYSLGGKETKRMRIPKKKVAAAAGKDETRLLGSF